MATALLLLIQVPPVAGESWAVSARQTADGALTIGNGLTVTVVETEFVQLFALV
jgi:hypothetical protein